MEAALHFPEFRMPHFAVPRYLDKPRTGMFEYDLVPVWTMGACLPTLALFLHRRDYTNLALYGLGFLVAVVYHVLALKAHNGLASNSFLGLNGAGWRTIDILSANMLLARTFGHALNVENPLVAALPNVVLPAAIVALLTSYPGVTLGLCSRLTMLAVVGTLVLQLLVEGRPLLRQLKAQYSQPKMWGALLAMFAGIAVFAVPTFVPDSYWLCHSLWHIIMGWGYLWLYQGLFDTHWAAWRKLRSSSRGRLAHVKATTATAGTAVPHNVSAADLYGLDNAQADAAVSPSAVDGSSINGYNSSDSAERLSGRDPRGNAEAAKGSSRRGHALHKQETVRRPVMESQHQAGDADDSQGEAEVQGRQLRSRRAARRL